MVNIDEIDLQIIDILYNLKDNETITTYQIAKIIFPYIEDEYEFKIKDNFIRTRLNKLAKYGLIKIDKASKKAYYFLILNNCYYKILKSKNPKISQKSYFLKINDRWYAFPFQNKNI